MKKIKGFTIIELMIVVLIVSALTSFAIPVYKDHMLTVRRTDAQKAIMVVSLRQEGHFAENDSYSKDLMDLGFASNSELTEDGYYTLTLTSTPGGCDSTGVGIPCTEYTLTASPTSGGPQESDNECGSFSMDNFGRKTSEFGECW